MHTNDGCLCNFVLSDNAFVFTIAVEYIIYKRSYRANYDVNIEINKKLQKVISFCGIFAPTDHTYKPLAEKSRDSKDSG